MTSWPTVDLLSHRAATTPDRTAMVDTDTGDTWTVRELDKAVDRLAARLAEAGVTDSTRVGVLLHTRPAYARLVHALQRLGAVLVPLHARKPADELTSPVERAGVDVLVCGRDTARTARELTDEVETVVSLDATNATDTLPAEYDLSALQPATWHDDDLAVVMFTSGTTGRPKGVRLTRGNLLSSAVASAYRLGVSPADRWLCCLPMYHMGGLAPVFRTTLYGTTLAIQRGFDAETTASILDEADITGVSLVPTMLTRLLDAGWEPAPTLETVLLGGAPASQDLIDRCGDVGVPVYPTYGTTETASQIATATPQQAVEYEGTVGQPLLSTTVEILSDGKRVETGETGELVASGPTVTPGYLDDERTAEAFDEDGFHTGDLGYRDEDGRLWVVGRADDLIVSGGENVAPATVAAAIRDHPAVADVAVVGLPDSEWGEAVAALVVASDETLDAATLDAHCRERLADYECPKQYGFVEDLPRTASGTIDRAAVVELLAANE